MKLPIICYIILLQTQIVLGQNNHAFKDKPTIDTGTFFNWPFVNGPAISNNGKFAYYSIINQPTGSTTLCLRGLDNNLSIDFPFTQSNCKFTSDSKYFLFIKNDTLYILNTLSSKILKFPNTLSYDLPAEFDNGWIAYLQNPKEKRLVLYNLISGTTQYFSGVEKYIFSKHGIALLILCKENKTIKDEVVLKIVRLNKNTTSTVWNGIDADHLTFDTKEEQVCFTGSNNESNKIYGLWHYSLTTEKVTRLFSDSTALKYGEFKIDKSSNISFSVDGSKIFFNVTKKLDKNPANTSVNVNIWSYTDKTLQSEQIKSTNNQTFRSTIHIRDKTFIQLEHKFERIRPSFFRQHNETYNDDNLIVIQREGALHEWNWNKSSLANIYVVSTNTGERRLLKEGVPSVSEMTFIMSPSGKYIIYFNLDDNNYYCYDTKNGVTKNITETITTDWAEYDYRDSPVKRYYSTSGVVGWLKNDVGVLIYDQHDIWLLDPTAARPPLNITNGYGRRHNIEFRLAFEAHSKWIDKSEEILLNAFNRKNKDNGYFIANFSGSKDPKMLYMGPYTFNGAYRTEVSQFTPTKATYARKYIVRRMSSTESANYFSTKDFKTFHQLSFVNPERNYNWLTTELVSWQTFDGKTSDGILFKPENFDSTKKYPLILHYYERFSETLHSFIKPGPSEGPMNIPYYVSDGYLVFVPDIHYTVGKPGESAFNSVVSVAKLLSQRQYVDKNKIGIQGHSFGGFQTNYIITKTNMFAAAMSSAGMSDFISCYGSIVGDGSSRQRQYELYRDRIGVSLWEGTNLYIENSPVLYANRVTTPLLMMNNIDDGDVPFGQGIELFTSLRRLGKKGLDVTI